MKDAAGSGAERSEHIVLMENAEAGIKRTISFLQLLMPETCAKRLVAVILLLIGLSNDTVSSLTGCSSRTVWGVRDRLKKGADAQMLFRARSGGRGAKSKTADVESEIVRELETNDYQTRQQVVDMIKEKFGITISVATAGRLLKKTASGG